MSDEEYIVDIFRDIVAATAVVVDYDVNYIHGHPFGIVDTLKGMTPQFNVADCVKKFPLIALIQDFEEKRGEDPDIAAKVRLNIIIACATFPHYTAPQRYTHSFRDTLYPLYEEFLNQVHLSRRFRTGDPSTIEHDKFDRLYWGKTGLWTSQGNVFQDYIDAIELQNFQLTLKTLNCLTHGLN